MKPLFLLLATLTLTSFVPQQSSLSELKWLVGKWQFEDRGITYYEEWKVKNEHLYTGSTYYTNREGKTVISETLELKEENGTAWYIPTDKEQNGGQPVLFKITSASGTGFVAENPEHDFPKIIAYTLTDESSLTATVGRGQDSMLFYFRKVK